MHEQLNEPGRDTRDGRYRAQGSVSDEDLKHIYARFVASATHHLAEDARTRAWSAQQTSALPLLTLVMMSEQVGIPFALHVPDLSLGTHHAALGPSLVELIDAAFDDGSRIRAEMRRIGLPAPHVVVQLSEGWMLAPDEMQSDAPSDAAVPDREPDVLLVGLHTPDRSVLGTCRLSRQGNRIEVTPNLLDLRNFRPALVAARRSHGAPPHATLH